MKNIVLSIMLATQALAIQSAMAQNNSVPTKPEFVEIQFTGTFNYEYLTFAWTAEVGLRNETMIKAISHNASHAFVKILYDVDDYFPGTQEVDIVNDTITIDRSIWSWDWGQYCVVVTCNEHGMSVSDTIYTNDYIDKDILALIYGEPTSIRDMQQNMSVGISDGMVWVVDSNATLHDTRGFAIPGRHEGGRTTFHVAVHGIYVLSAIIDGKKCTKKIRL